MLFFEGYVQLTFLGSAQTKIMIHLYFLLGKNGKSIRDCIIITISL
jgi:hypothetical protein